jgi:DNA topoisomerase-3
MMGDASVRQTAALAIIVRRQREIENFKPERYYNIAAHVKAGGNTITLLHAPKEGEGRIKDAAEARRITDEIHQKSISLTVESKKQKEAPPPLFESSSLQIAAYNLWGWTATKTEGIAQALYDKHKLISYPRTDGVHLETEQWGDVGQILSHLKELPNTNSVPLKAGQTFIDLAAAVPEYNSLTPRDTVFNSELLEKSGADHHGIIPTTEAADLSALTEDERKLYLLIVRQFLAQLYGDCHFIQKSISWTHEGRRFSATGRTILDRGWKDLWGKAGEDPIAKDDDGEEQVPEQIVPDIPDGTRGLVEKSTMIEKKTIAPPQFTEGSMISAMRDLTKVTKDPDDLKTLKHGKTLGTKSTWGDTIKKLKDRYYIVSAKGKLTPTNLGRDLIELCETYVPTLVQPTSTALLEQMLNDVEKNQYDTVKAREILQGRNIDAIKRCLEIESAQLRTPELVKKPTSKSQPIQREWKDFPEGSYELDAPYDDREKIKALGGRFNGETKRWHVSKKAASEEDLRKRGWLK